ncbi:MAG TPA: hypothetical protein EYN07_03480 [Flavobacteriaceae bacterium]|nr:hypothetical protein [Flavobacteriaceae bacterium]HIN98283.1 hypothetical protein [Flavobacteriaceae bacterium]
MKKTNQLFPFILFAALSMFIITSCEDPVDPPQNSKPPAQLVSVGQAKEMFDAYSERRVQLIRNYESSIDSTQDFHPTRFGEYDYETMKQYMAFIESEAKLANVRISGLRFYLVNYPNAGQFGDGNDIKYPRQNSFVLVPTTKADGEELGFITRKTADGGRTVVYIKDWLKEQPGGDTPEQQRTNKQNQTRGALNATGSPGFAKPKFMFINAMMGANMSVDDGDDVSLLLNESNLVPPPPQQGTDFDD